MSDQFRPSDRVIFRFLQTSSFKDQNGEQIIGRPGNAELHLTVQEVSQHGCDLVVDHLVFTSETPYDHEDAFQPTYTFLTSSGRGSLIEEGEYWMLELALFANIISKQSIADVVAIRSDCVEELAAVAIGAEADLGLSAFESTDFRVMFKAPETARAPTELSIVGELSIVESSVHFQALSTENNIATVSTQIEKAALLLGPGAVHQPFQATFLAHSIAPAEVVFARFMHITPYFVITTPQDAQDFPPALQAWLEEANRIWGDKGCIRIEQQSHQQISESDLLQQTSTTNLLNAIRKWSQPPGGQLSLFIVNPSSLSSASDDGGITDVRFQYQQGAKIMIIERIILASNAAPNTRILAHELGHALGGVHHNDNPQLVQWRGDDNSILTPSGAVHLLNPDRNTRHNCVSARHPALITPGHFCEAHYDI
ncbi:MAG: hypothetical protein ACK4SA_10710 [Caldilinea sp.]